MTMAEKVYSLTDHRRFGNCRELKDQIRGWADHLQNSEIQGQRRINDNTRRAYTREKSVKAFMQKLQDFRDAAKEAEDRTTK